MEEENTIRVVINELLSQSGGNWQSVEELASQPDAEITFKRLQRYFPDRDINGMSRDEIEDNLDRYYRGELQLDGIESVQVTEVILRAAWNLGLQQAITLIQKAANLKQVDGIMGPQTLRAVNKLGEKNFLRNFGVLFDRALQSSVSSDDEKAFKKSAFNTENQAEDILANAGPFNEVQQESVEKDGDTIQPDSASGLAELIDDTHISDDEKKHWYKATEELLSRLGIPGNQSANEIESIRSEIQQQVAELHTSNEEKQHLSEAVNTFIDSFTDDKVDAPRQQQEFNVDAIAKKSTSDIWTIKDQLGYESYAQAIAKLVVDGKAEPPLTISIQAPWGQGKTSLMRMIKHKLEHGLHSEDKTKTTKQPEESEKMPGTQAKLNNLDDWIDSEKQQADQGAAMLNVDSDRIPCVWFNPLYYEDSKQIWSGLAHSILHQLADQLPSKLDKERFWFRLRLTRINTQAIRRDIHILILERLLPKGLVWFGILLAGLMTLNYTSSTVESFLTIYPLFNGVPFLGALGHIVWNWLGKNRDWSLDDKLASYINEPEYEGDLGLLHLVEHDLDRALKLLLGKDGRLVVFIDDLDRCTPSTVNDILLAINQFISVQHRKLYFILGMDTHMVAMAIETAADKQAATYNKNRHTSKGYGWRFMEKFVQLPFFIPRISPNEAQKFLSDLLKSEQEEAASSEQIVELRNKINETASLPELQDLVVSFKSQHDIDFIPEIDASVASRMIDLTSEEDSEVLGKLVSAAMSDLELNPREMKRFLNVARLLFIRVDHEDDVSSYDHMLKVVRASHLILNWPQCLRWLQGNARCYTQKGIKVDPVDSIEDMLHDAKNSDYEDWCDAITQTWGDSVADVVAEPDFYTFAKRIHDAPPNLKDIFTARIF